MLARTIPVDPAVIRAGPRPTPTHIVEPSAPPGVGVSLNGARASDGVLALHTGFQ